LFLVPVSLLAWLFVQQSFKDINFAQKSEMGSSICGAPGVLMSLIRRRTIRKRRPPATSPAILSWMN